MNASLEMFTAKNVPYWPLFNRPLLRTKVKFLSKGPVEKRPVKVDPVKLKADKFWQAEIYSNRYILYLIELNVTINAIDGINIKIEC